VAKAPKRSQPSDGELRDFVEEVGMLFEKYGQPRMAGRIVGHLLVCDPPQQSQQDLAEALQASIGSISTMTRQLQQVGLVERIGVPGERRVHFRLADDAWTRMMQDGVQRATEYRELADRGLAMFGGAPPAFRERLQHLHDITEFLEREWPAVFIKWKTLTAGARRKLTG
jgi:hypothetical protein